MLDYDSRDEELNGIVATVLSPDDDVEAREHRHEQNLFLALKHTYCSSHK